MPANDAPFFLLSLNIGPFRAKRQSTTPIVGQNGGATHSCSNALIFTLSDGQLYANGTGALLQYGADTGVPYADLSPSVAPGPIRSALSVDADYNLVWSNSAFFDGRASFCVTATGTIVAVFVAPELGPQGCTFLNLKLSRIGQCAVPSFPASTTVRQHASSGLETKFNAAITDSKHRVCFR